ncbi:PEP-CTERM sorting domain-containing protein [Desulforhopalus sp. 52FAK]
MNIYATSKLTTLAIIMGIASFLYMTPHQNTDISASTIELSSVISVNENESNAPAPATMLLFGTGLAGFATVIKRKKN